MLTPVQELGTLPALKKRIAKIRQIENAPVVSDLQTVSEYQRLSLIENNIPFVTKKQIFLSFIGTMLTEEKEPERYFTLFLKSEAV